MRRLWLRFGIVAALMVGSTSGCFVRTERTVVEKPVAAKCASSAWVEGHYTPQGRWVPGYWVCTRTTY
jgi:hypothetical protein